MKKLYEYTCPFCGNYEKVTLDLDEIDELICKKCNQKIDLDLLNIVESSSMEFHGEAPTPYNPNEDNILRR